MKTVSHALFSLTLLITSLSLLMETPLLMCSFLWSNMDRMSMLYWAVQPTLGPGARSLLHTMASPGADVLVPLMMTVPAALAACHSVPLKPDLMSLTLRPSGAFAAVAALWKDCCMYCALICLRLLLRIQECHIPLELILLLVLKTSLRSIFSAGHLRQSEGLAYVVASLSPYHCHLLSPVHPLCQTHRCVVQVSHHQ